MKKSNRKVWFWILLCMSLLATMGCDREVIAPHDEGNGLYLDALARLGIAQAQAAKWPVDLRREILDELKRGSKLTALECKEDAEHHFTLSLMVIDRGIDKHNWNERVVYLYYQWDRSPYWKLVDQAGIAWSDGWNIKNGSEVMVYQYQGERTRRIYTRSFQGASYTAESGVTYNHIDLKELTPDGMEHTASHRGWMKVTIGKYVNQTAENDLERTEITGKYFHRSQRIGFQGTLTVMGGPNLAITHKDNYNTFEGMLQFDWPV